MQFPFVNLVSLRMHHLFFFIVTLKTYFTKLLLVSQIFRQILLNSREFCSNLERCINALYFFVSPILAQFILFIVTSKTYFTEVLLVSKIFRQLLLNSRELCSNLERDINALYFTLIALSVSVV